MTPAGSPGTYGPTPPRHRAPRWPRRHPVATAAAAFAGVLVLVVALGVAVGPHIDQPVPFTAVPTGSGPVTGAPPWPAVAIPTIGAPGAWNPDTDPPVNRAPTPEQCSRCGERTTTPTSPPASAQAAPAQPAPAQPALEQPAPEPAAQPQAAATVPLLELVNADRLANGCPPVTEDPSLVAQSQTWSEQQAADDTMEHSPGVTGFDTWGENVADGYDTAAAVHASWMGSAPHRANILNCAFTVMGAGAADSATGVRYWTEQFAAS